MQRSYLRYFTDPATRIYKGSEKTPYNNTEGDT